MTQQSLWQNRNYRLVFSASAISNLGDGVSALALPWLATLITRDPVLIALVAMAQRLPWLLFALPAGVWTDRADRRRLIARADLLRMVLTLGIVALALTATPFQPRMIYPLAILAFLLGAAEVLRDNAAQTILPSVVASADLERANGQMWSAEQITGQFIGPPLAGALIGLGIAVPFDLDAATFALASILVWLIVLPPRAPMAPQRFWPALQQGIGWIRGHRTILQLAVMLGFVNFLHMACFTVLVLYSQEILGLSGLGYGLLLTTGAAGGVIGGLVAPRIAARLGMRRSLIAALATFVGGYLLLSLGGLPLIAGAALFIEAIASMLWNVVTVSYRQRQIPGEILGRVNSVYRFFGWGSMPLGAMAGGALVAVAEHPLGRDMALRLPFAAATIGMAILALYAASRLPRHS